MFAKQFSEKKSKYWSQIIVHALNNKSIAHLLIITYKLKKIYQCKYVLNDALWHKYQLVFYAHIFKSIHPIVNFYAGAPMQIIESYLH